MYYESDWGTEEWTRGAYAASFDLGGLHRYGADLRTPVGPIHFACSDMAGAGYQHVDGAIRMGRLVAREHHRGGPRMSGRIVVGYTATDAGADAVALGARLAAASDAVLDIVVVLPADEPQRDHAARCRLRALPAAAGRASGSPRRRSDGRRMPSPQRTHIRYAESFAEGLVAAAAEFGASLIVVGAADGGLRGRHRLGTVASELLHSSDVPGGARARGLAADRRRPPASPASRRRSARARAPTRCSTRARRSPPAHGAELRLLSLVSVDLPASVDTGVIRIAGAAHADEVLAKARARSPTASTPRSSSPAATASRTPSRTSSWDPGEIVARRLEPPRPAAPPVPRLDRREDAARTARSR